jgi:transposase
MTRPLSIDLRSRVVAAVSDGLSCRAAAEQFDLAASTVVKWMQRWRDTGSCEPRPQGGDKRSGPIEARAEEILALIAGKVDITLAEIAEHLESRYGERFAPSTIWRCLDRHAQTFKKNRARKRTGPPGRGARKAGLASGAA